MQKAIHDLNNMLMSILAHSELLPLRVPNSPEVQKAATEIRTAAVNARDMVKTLREYFETGESRATSRIDTAVHLDPLSAEDDGNPPPRTDVGPILVVDDEPSVLGFVQILLEQEGYRVLTAGSPAKALEVFLREHENISLVMADFSMAQVNGAQLLKEMAMADPDVPSVISSGFDVTGSALVRDISTLRGFLDKPFGRDDLLRTIDLAARKIKQQ